MAPIHPRIVTNEPEMAQNDKSQRRFCEQKCKFLSMISWRNKSDRASRVCDARKILPIECVDRFYGWEEQWEFEGVEPS